jgi:hypothetical protein
MKYKFMLAVAFVMALFSSILTAFGMQDLFATAGMFILILFLVIDLGRFLLFNFVVDEWSNLRGVKYIITLILALLFVYSAIGVYSKLDSLVSKETREAMINVAYYNKLASNAENKQLQNEDFIAIARKEYDTAIEWNKVDYQNCIKRANGNVTKENTCNNTKRRLDKNALSALEKVLSSNTNLSTENEEKIKQVSENKSEIASVLTTICKFTQKECNSYDSLQNALTIVILLVIVGTDYLQIAIVLAVNTRRNKKIKKEEYIERVKYKNDNLKNNSYIKAEDVKSNKLLTIKKVDSLIGNFFNVSKVLSLIKRKNQEKFIENLKNPMQEKVILAHKEKIKTSPPETLKKHFFVGPKPK